MKTLLVNQTQGRENINDETKTIRKVSKAQNLSPAVLPLRFFLWGELSS
jgi:hypothetical protein